jgi:hypothetical protein
LFSFGRVQVLDHGGNLIVDQYWELEGPMQIPRQIFLNLTVTARLVASESFRPRPSSLSVGNSQQLAHPQSSLLPPFSMPGNFFNVPFTLLGTVSITMLTDPKFDHFCPNGCSSQGTCIQGSCQCETGWGGAACVLSSPPVQSCSFSYYCPNSPGWLAGASCSCIDNITAMSSPTATALFSDLMVDLVGGGYVLFFESSNLFPAWTYPFWISAGNASHLWVLAHPRGAVGGSFLDNWPVIQVQRKYHFVKKENIRIPCTFSSNFSVNVLFGDKYPLLGIS